MNQEKNPLVSIVIPVFNGAEFMREAIDSALGQTYPNIEVLVINDGSSDHGKTEDIAKSYGDKIRYFQKQNGGVASALNLGIREMKGGYFSWLSHDDSYLPNKVEVQIQFLQTLGTEAVLYSDIEYMDEQSKKISEYLVREVSPEKFIWELLRRPFLVHGCTVLCPKLFLKEAGFFNESLRTTQDYELWFRLAKIFSFYHVPKILIRSRLHSHQSSQTMKKVFQKEKKELRAWVWNFFPLSDLQQSCGKKFPLWCMKMSCGWDNFIWDVLDTLSNIVPQKIRNFGMNVFLKKRKNFSTEHENAVTIKNDEK